MLISYQLDEVCPSVSSGSMLRPLCVRFGKWTLRVLLMSQLVSCVLVVWGPVVFPPRFFPPKVILPLDCVLGSVCHLGVVIPPQ